MTKQKAYVVKGVGVILWLPEDLNQGISVSLKSGGWLVGSFDSVPSALKGAEYDLDLNEAYYALQKKINHVDQENRLITIDDLASLD